ncbi:MAG: ATP-grasp domain-containing protein [Planctomycetota bacterium]|jgi:D-alanine-D-alanine ligase
MKVAVVYNRQSKKVINVLGLQNREKYGKEAIDRVVAALRKGGHQVKTFEGDKDLIDALEDFMPRVVKGERPGMVFNLAYGVQGQARYTHVPGILEMVGLPYVGSGPMAHSLALDKVVAKMIFLQNGLPTPAFAVLESKDFELPEVPFPQIVKPRNEAMSFGLKIVHDEAELCEAAGVILDEFQQAVLVEQYIEGREVNVGLIGNSPVDALPPAELSFGGDGPRVYTVEDKRGKSGRTVAVICPADLDAEQTARVQEIARGAFNALGCVDCARVDLRMDEAGDFYILEVNSLPSLGEHGSFVQAAEAVGMDFPALIQRLLEVASARYFGTPSPPQITEDGKPVEKGENRIFSYVTESRDSLEARLKEWTQISSRSLDPLGILSAEEELDRRLRRLGMQPVENFTDAPEVVTWETPAGFDGGTLLIGHLDVPLPIEDAMPAFRRDPEWLHGEGIGSSRAPLVMMEFALAALRRIRKLKSAKIGVLYYSDEGLDCVGSTKLISAAIQRAKRVLVLRPGNPGDNVIHQRRGLRRYRLHAQGEPRRLGQGSRRKTLMTWLSRKLDECTALTDRKHRVAVAVGKVSTRAWPLLLPHETHVTLLVGFPDTAKADDVESKLREILSQDKDGVRWKLNLVAHRPAMPDRKLNKALRAEMKSIANDWEIPFEHESSLLPSVAGLVPEGVAVACGIGPASIDPYTAQEAVQRISLVQRTLLLAAYLEKVAQE